MPGRGRKGEAQIDPRVDRPARDDEAAPSEAVRQRARRGGAQRDGQVERSQEQEDLQWLKAERLGAEHQEGVTRVPQGEDHEHNEVRPKAAVVPAPGQAHA